MRSFTAAIFIAQVANAAITNVTVAEKNIETFVLAADECLALKLKVSRKRSLIPVLV